MKWLICALILLNASVCIAKDKPTLILSFWTEAGAPFVITEKVQSSPANGIIPEIGQYLAEQLDVNIEYLNLPVQRIEPFLHTGEIHLDCITSPIWKETPDAYDWSPVLFDGADRFLINPSKNNNFSKFEDLKGKNLGVYNGYVYHPTIMKMMDSGELSTVKIVDIDHGIKLLGLGRLDALIDFDILLNYKIQLQKEIPLALADLHADNYQLYCAYSKSLPIKKAELDRVFQEMISTGKMAQILNSYR